MPIIFDFSNCIAERTRHFVGREWVFAEIDRWLADTDGPRYFIITGEPGIGKTAIAGRLTQFSDGIVTPPEVYNRIGEGFLSAVHFCNARCGGWISPDSFARSLSTQLAMRYPAFAEAIASDLPVHIEQHIGTNLGTIVGTWINNYYAENAEALFNSLVRLPLQALFRRDGPPKPLVILVDGLDEALSYSGRASIVRLLATCDDLPAPVRFLLTSRPVDGVMEPFRPLQPFVLLIHSEDNQRDLSAYMQGRFEASAALRAAAGSEGQVARAIDSLVKRSSGNFLVVSKVLDAIERGETDLADPDKLPAELKDLYAWFLGRWIQRDMKAWRELYRPVLGILVAAQEPVGKTAICQWTGLTLQQVIDALHDLQEFLKLTPSHCYRLYHESFVSFLVCDEAGPYRVNAVEYHRQIVDHYRGEASTWDKVDWTAVDDYGKRHLAVHLYALKDVEPLCTLVESRTWIAAKYVDTPWVGSLIQDLQVASAVAAEGDIGDWARAMGYQLRRALIEALMSQSSTRAILFLARLGQIDRALDLAKRQWNKFDLLREIARAVAPTQPNKAVDILTELARLNDPGSTLEQCEARLAVAQEILRQVPSRSEVALNLREEAKHLERMVPDAELVKYRVMWDLPTLALSGYLDVALAGSATFPPLQQAKALRRISSVLPEDHPSKHRLLEQALCTLEALEQTPETLSERVRSIVALLPLVDRNEQKRWLNLLESTGAILCSIKAPVEYAVMPHWAIGRVAAIDLDWARRMLLESNWDSTPDTLYEVAREIARVDYEEALQIVREQLSNHILAPSLLIHIIGIVAAKDANRAAALIDEYAKHLRGRNDKSDAYIAVAEACLTRGNAKKAREIFDEHAIIVGGEGLAHAREDIQLAILARSTFLPVEAACDRLMRFPTCPRCHRSQKREAEIILARIAARQNRLDILRQHRFGREAQLAAAYDLAGCVGPQAAREYLQSQRIASFMRGTEQVYAHIAGVEAQQDPSKLNVLLDHFDDNGRPHHFCPYMRELPYALQGLVETRRIEPAEAMSLIDRLCPSLVDWQCPRGDQLPERESWKPRCDCYGHSEHVLIRLTGIVALLDPNQADEMITSLPAQPIKVYALAQVLHHTHAYETLVPRIIKASQECIKDPWQRAELYYTLAIHLPTEMSDTIQHLIDLAEPLLDEAPTYYRSQTGLKKHKARALLKLVGDINQFAHVIESLETIENLVQLDDKLQVLDLLAQQAAKWSERDKLALLWRIWELSNARELTDVQVFTAFSIPLVHSLGGEEVFWRLYECVEWAYEELPQVS